MNYLVDLPHIPEKGLPKILLVRKEVIHIKHILTEIFIRKTIDIESMLKYINMNLLGYLELKLIYGMVKKLTIIHLIQSNND